MGLGASGVVMCFFGIGTSIGDSVAKRSDAS